MIVAGASVGKKGQMIMSTVKLFCGFYQSQTCISMIQEAYSDSMCIHTEIHTQMLRAVLVKTAKSLSSL